MHYLLLFCLVSLLTSCKTRQLEVQTLYLTPQSQASAFVLSPSLSHPSIGQQLLIQWDLKKQFYYYQTVSFQLKLRFNDHEEQTIQKQIKAKKGSYLYEVLNEKYLQNGGVATYLLEIYGDHVLIDSWQHPLWAKRIKFD